MIDFAASAGAALLGLIVIALLVFLGWDVLQNVAKRGWIASVSVLVVGALVVWGVANIEGAPDLVDTTVDEINQQGDKLDTTFGD